MLDYKRVNHELRNKFRVKRGDVPPYIGWLRPSVRRDLYDVMNDMGHFKIGAEIGVNVATNARIMLNRINGLHLTCVDPWEAYGKHNQAKIDALYDRAMDKLKRFRNNERVTIIRKRSMDALNDIPDKSLDFVYIDGLHYFNWVMPDIIFWAEKVRKHGIVAGHDYYQFYRGGVTTAVDAYTKAHHITDWYITREMHPTWFWVKQ